ncbi:UNVERIFIED_CONTAM: hypothetical protein K2H54_017275 [Gekko kuhli]
MDKTVDWRANSFSAWHYFPPFTIAWRANWAGGGGKWHAGDGSRICHFSPENVPSPPFPNTHLLMQHAVKPANGSGMFHCGKSPSARHLALAKMPPQHRPIYSCPQPHALGQRLSIPVKR